jgi:hypothetical protein
MRTSNGSAWVQLLVLSWLIHHGPVHRVAGRQQGRLSAQLWWAVAQPAQDHLDALQVVVDCVMGHAVLTHHAWATQLHLGGVHLQQQKRPKPPAMLANAKENAAAL